MDRDCQCGDIPTKHVYESIYDFLAYTSKALPEIDVSNYDHQTFLLHLLHTERSDSAVALLPRSTNGQAGVPVHAPSTRVLLGLHTIFLSALSCVFLDDPQHTLIHPHAPTKDAEHAPLIYVPPANIQQYFCSYHRPCNSDDPVAWLFYSLYPLVALLGALHAYGYPFDEYFTYWPLQVLKRTQPLSTLYSLTLPHVPPTDAACASELRPRPHSDRVQGLVVALLQPYVPVALLIAACSGWETESTAARVWAQRVGGVLDEGARREYTQREEAGKVMDADGSCVCRMCAVLAALQHTEKPSLAAYTPQRAVGMVMLPALPMSALGEDNYGDHPDFKLLVTLPDTSPGMSGVPREARLQAAEHAWATLMRRSCASTITACAEAATTHAHISAAPISTGNTPAASVDHAAGEDTARCATAQVAAEVVWGAQVGTWVEVALKNVFHACASEVSAPAAVEKSRVADGTACSAFPFVCGSNPLYHAAYSDVAIVIESPTQPRTLPVPSTLIDMCNKLIYLCVAALPAHPERIFYLACALSRAVDSLSCPEHVISRPRWSRVWRTLRSCCLHICLLILVTPLHVLTTWDHADSGHDAWFVCNKTLPTPSSATCRLRASTTCPANCQSCRSHIASASTTHLSERTFAVLGELLARVDLRLGAQDGNSDVTSAARGRTDDTNVLTGYLSTTRPDQMVPIEVIAPQSDMCSVKNDSSLTLLRALMPAVVQAVDAVGGQAFMSTAGTVPTANDWGAYMSGYSSRIQQVAINTYVEVLMDHYHAYVRMHASGTAVGDTHISSSATDAQSHTPQRLWVAGSTRPLVLTSSLLSPHTPTLSINLMASLRSALPHTSFATDSSAWRSNALHALLHWPEQSLLALWLLRRRVLLRYAHFALAMQTCVRATSVVACAHALEDDTLMRALLHAPHWCDASGTESPAASPAKAWWSVDVVVCESVMVAVADSLLADAQAVANPSIATHPAACSASAESVSICVGAVVVALARCDADSVDMAVGALLRAAELHSASPVGFKVALGISAECLCTLLLLSVWVEVRVRETLVEAQRACRGVESVEADGCEGGVAGNGSTMAGMLDWARERGLLGDSGGVTTAPASICLAAAKLDWAREEACWAPSNATLGRPMLLSARVAMLIREVARIMATSEQSDANAGMDIPVVEKADPDNRSNCESLPPLAAQVCELLRSYLNGEQGSGGGKGRGMDADVGKDQEEYSGRYTREDIGVPETGTEWESGMVALLHLLLPQHRTPVSSSFAPMQRAGDECRVPRMRGEVRRAWLQHVLAMVSGEVDAGMWVWGADEDEGDDDADAGEGEEGECWADGWAEEGEEDEWDEDEDAASEAGSATE